MGCNSCGRCSSVGFIRSGRLDSRAATVAISRRRSTHTPSRRLRSANSPRARSNCGRVSMQGEYHTRQLPRKMQQNPRPRYRQFPAGQGGSSMPRERQNWYSGNHPHACTCVECGKSRRRGEHAAACGCWRCDARRWHRAKRWEEEALRGGPPRRSPPATPRARSTQEQRASRTSSGIGGAGIAAILILGVSATIAVIVLGTT